MPTRTIAPLLVKVFVALLSISIPFATGCKPAAVSTQPPAPPTPSVQTAEANSQSDACKLLTSGDIQAVQGEPVKEVKGSVQNTGRLSVSQCFYTTANFANSISLALTQKNAGSTNVEDIKEFWNEKFKGAAGREREVEEEREREKDKGKKRDKREEREEEEGQPMRHVAGLGDDAYWEGDNRVGALYVLKGDRFLRISIGGNAEQGVKLDKLKKLATEALKRL